MGPARPRAGWPSGKQGRQENRASSSLNYADDDHVSDQNQVTGSNGQGPCRRQSSTSWPNGHGRHRPRDKAAGASPAPGGVSVLRHPGGTSVDKLRHADQQAATGFRWAQIIAPHQAQTDPHWLGERHRLRHRRRIRAKGRRCGLHRRTAPGASDIRPATGRRAVSSSACWVKCTVEDSRSVGQSTTPVKDQTQSSLCLRSGGLKEQLLRPLDCRDPQAAGGGDAILAADSRSGPGGWLGDLQVAGLMGNQVAAATLPVSRASPVRLRSIGGRRRSLLRP